MAQNKFRKLRWESVDEIARSNARRAAARGLEPPGPAVAEEHPLVKLLRRTNIPRHPDPEASAREEAEFLLQAASEVEHQFIVQYLYALFSLDRINGGEVALECQTHFREIAEEEMGHLLTVQNALLLIGAPPYLDREHSPPLEPQPFPLVLEPASLSFVARFLVAESPVDAELPDNLGDLKKTIDHVGVLYAMLYWLFQDSDTPQEPWLLPAEMFPAGQHLQAGDYNTDMAQIENLLNTAPDWQASGGIHVLPSQLLPLDTPARIADATRRALFDIALQGEGPVETGPNEPKETSHFHRLLGLYNSIKTAPAGLLLALDVPVDPHTQPLTSNPETEPGLITDVVALIHARFFNLRYEMLLLEIALSVIVPRSKVVDSRTVKAELARRAINVGMRRGVGALGRKLVTLPLKLSQGGVAPPFAGTPFDFPEDFFPDNERAGWERLLALIDRSIAMVEDAGNQASSQMRSLRQQDEAFRPFVLARISEFASDPNLSPEINTMATVYRIHPSIGIARVGNRQGTAEQDFFIGPESPGHHPQPPGGYKRGGKIKRQGARFRVYEYVTDQATGELRPVREINSNNANIKWTVHLVNKKAAAQIFPPLFTVLRNASIESLEEREELLVLQKQESINSSDRGPRPLDDFFLDRGDTKADTHRVHLGDLLTDEKGRLIVLGGYGKSFSPTGNSLQDTFNNDEWCDDTCDGIVTAEITLNGATSAVNAESKARVIVGPPDYAPAIDSIVSIFDLAEDIATRLPASAGPLPGPEAGTVSFARHVYPVLKRVARMHWVTSEADGAHAPGMQADFLRNDILQLLRNPNPASTSAPFKARQHVLDRLAVPIGSTANPGSRPDMPQLSSELDTGRELTLTLLQFGRMQRWAKGDFNPDTGVQLDVPPRPFDQITDVAEQTAALDKAGLDSTVGGSFYPGIEASRMIREVSTWATPFRISNDVPAGALTEGMALPWQTDFLACGQTWWPANRPDRVKRRNPQNPTQFLTADWEPFGTTDLSFTTADWAKVAFVVADGDAFVESERDETVDTLGPSLAARGPGGVERRVRVPFRREDLIVADE